MGKMSELDMVITDLRRAAEAINTAADILAEMFRTPATPKAEPPAPTMSLPEVRAILAEKSRAGHTAEIKALLQKYGADKLSAIAPEHYAALVADAEVL